ncbi:MAG: hypothetical protein DRN00_01780 [Thermoplasmata archaeon]|nr:MAG: hypothetical protein DRN00_01780 [Thermoplasmata archaeon]
MIYKTIFKLTFPVALGVGGVIALYLYLDESTWMKLWPLMTAYFFPPLGKESVIPAGIAMGLHPALIALSIAFMDMVASLFVVWNYDFIKKIPFLGKYVEKIESLGKRGSKRYRWVRALGFIGVILFVMIPFQGSGGVVGSILGRLIGLRACATWLAVSSGAILGCMLLAYFANFIKMIVVKNLMLGIFVVVLMVLIFLLYKVAKETFKGGDLLRSKARER